MKTHQERQAMLNQVEASSTKSARDEYIAMRGILAGCLKDFKQLEQDEPELAEKLGFAGYVQFSQIRLLDEEHYLVLNTIEDKIEALGDSVQKARNLLEHDVLPYLEILEKQ